MEKKEWNAWSLLQCFLKHINCFDNIQPFNHLFSFLLSSTHENQFFLSILVQTAVFLLKKLPSFPKFRFFANYLPNHSYFFQLFHVRLDQSKIALEFQEVLLTVNFVNFSNVYVFYFFDFSKPQQAICLLRRIILINFLILIFRFWYFLFEGGVFFVLVNWLEICSMLLAKTSSQVIPFRPNLFLRVWIWGGLNLWECHTMRNEHVFL